MVWETEELNALNKQTPSFHCVNHLSNEETSQIINDHFATICHRLH